MSGDTDIHVLHVDDEPDFADVTATFLEREDESLSVTTATSAEEGLDRLAADDVDCVLSDYDMPGTNGIEFLETVRDEYGDLPFVLYTGKGSEEIASEAVSAGVTDYLQKSSGTEQYALLVNRIHNAVTAYRNRQQAARQEEINTLIRSLNRQLVEAETVAAIERTVCETLADSESYRFAWIGAPDPDTGKIHPRTSAGDAAEYLEEVTIRYDDSPRGRGPGGRAIRTQEPQLAENIPDDPSFEPWQETAETYGYESVIVLPLVCEEGLHGVLAVYADHPYAFSETEQEVLEELAETISEAIQAAKTRDTLRQREDELQLKTRAMDEAPVGIIVTDYTREDNPISYVNERFTELTGYDEEEVLGRNCRFLQGDRTDPEPVGKMREAIDDGEEVTVELRNYRADGTEFWNRVSIAPIRDGDDIEHWVGFQQDVTDRRDRERELREWRTFIEGSLDALDDVFYVFDADGEILEYNDRVREVTGYTDEEIARMGPTDFFPDDHKERIAESVTEVLETGSAKVQADYLTKDGRRVPYEFTGVRLTDEEGTVLGFAGIGRDVSDRLAYERQLEAQNERLEEFASIVSHDLRNPLNVASARLQLASEECDSPHLDDVASAHERMERLIDEMLTLARQGDIATDLRPISLERAAQQCWENVQTGEATLVVETDARVRADGERLKQLLENLLRNAVGHGGDNVTIRIGRLSEGDGLYVADNGPGIPPEERDKVFDRGYTTDDEGIGMGLSIVRKIADAHGWEEVRVTESDEGGARFEITGVEFV